jgi:opacity protein-like surface antigen
MGVAKRHILFLLAVALALSTVLPSQASALKVGDRKSWMLGISIGFGRGNFLNADGSESEYRDGIVPQYRIGKMLGRRFMLNFESQNWLIEGGNLDSVGDENFDKIRRSLQTWTLALTVYPGNLENAWSGLYFRAGAGVGLAGTAFILLNEELEQENAETAREDDFGLGLVGTVGYEFWVLNNVTTGVAASFNYVAIDDSEERLVDKAGFAVPIAFNLNWYF